MQIELKTLKYDNPPTIPAQMLKVEEEDGEFATAVIRGDINNALEEFYDKLMASVNLLRVMGIPLDVIVRAQKNHFEKLEARGWKLSGK